ncbi:MAG: flavin reductase family protein [Rhodospirillaceae bacterium]|nr:flavin reductase family protein [Rhodospirillaceae bacterium]
MGITISPTNEGTGSGLTIGGKAGIDPAGSEAARRQFRDTLGHFCTGVTVMTALVPHKDGTPGTEYVGITVSSFNSLSLDPPMILWSIARDSVSYNCYQVGSAFAVNVLSVEQEALAHRFARTGRDKFDGVPLHIGLDAVPLIDGCVVYLECRTEARYPGGDHDIIVGRVRRIFNIGKAPLLFHIGALRGLGV